MDEVPPPYSVFVDLASSKPSFNVSTTKIPAECSPVKDEKPAPPTFNFYPPPPPGPPPQSHGHGSPVSPMSPFPGSCAPGPSHAPLFIPPPPPPLRSSSPLSVVSPQPHRHSVGVAPNPLYMPPSPALRPASISAASGVSALGPDQTESRAQARPSLPLREHSTPSPGIPHFQQRWSQPSPAVDGPALLRHETALEVPPALPPRPTSAPPIPTPGVKEDLVATSSGAQFQPPPSPTGFGPKVFMGDDDQKKSGFGKRFVSNMLVTRVGRATWQSAASTVSLPFHLSPWGDNNPVTLPNVRKRDVALAGLAHFGVDALASSSVDLMGEVVQYAGTFTAEQAVHQGIDGLAKEKPQKFVVRAGVTSTQLRIKHKMIGEQAEVTLFAPRPAGRYTCCAKGWFCPYLYASGRAPHLERNKDFAIAQFWGPGLAADAEVAPTLLACVSQNGSAPIETLCAWERSSMARPRFTRMAVMLIGISPCRTASAWSQARIPGEARLQFHLLSGIPMLVVPAMSTAPINAWSGHTLRQLWDGEVAVEEHVADVLAFLAHVVDVQALGVPHDTDWQNKAASTLRQMFDAALLLKGGAQTLFEGVDPERAGLVMMRY